MITKIEKIKNLGIFTDYKWDSNLPEFKRFNLIYGWNGSGKTTLSQLFDSLEATRTLEKLQGTLLPKLISGQIRINNLENFDVVIN